MLENIFNFLNLVRCFINYKLNYSIIKLFQMSPTNIIIIIIITLLSTHFTITLSLQHFYHHYYHNYHYNYALQGLVCLLESSFFK
jgi:hypothetical protein